MTTRNPFPGMNPFFEQRWRDAHTRLIAYLTDALQERLPADLEAAAEEEVVVIGTGELAPAFRPDVQGRNLGCWRIRAAEPSQRGRLSQRLNLCAFS